MERIHKLIREWLNSDFYDTAFTREEQGLIFTTDVDGNKTIHSVSITGNTMIFGDGAGGHFTLIKQ